MAKDPAFLFYPGDWLSGTMYLTHEQKGAYIDLLILQFNCGKFTEAQAKQVLSICFDVAWPMLEQKFVKQGNFYFNARLQSEIDKRQLFTESRRNNAKGPKTPKPEPIKTEIKPEASAEHMLQHMEDENKDIDLVLLNSIMEFFNFSEFRNYDKMRDIKNFLVCLEVNNRLDYFKEQFPAYCRVKAAEPKFKNQIKTFLGNPKELYEDGAWNAENWLAKSPSKPGANKFQF